MSAIHFSIGYTCGRHTALPSVFSLSARFSVLLVRRRTPSGSAFHSWCPSISVVYQNRKGCGSEITRHISGQRYQQILSLVLLLRTADRGIRRIWVWLFLVQSFQKISTLSILLCLWISAYTASVFQEYFVVVYASGTRAQEICDLRVKDVTYDASSNAILKFLGKRSRGRI